MHWHIRILAVLNISFGGTVGTLVAVESFWLIQHSLRPVPGAFQDLAGCAIALMAATFAVVVLPTMALIVIGGIGLLWLRRWARTLTIATSLLLMGLIPMGAWLRIDLITPLPILASGIALPVFGLWVLLNGEGRRRLSPRLPLLRKPN